MSDLFDDVPVAFPKSRLTPEQVWLQAFCAVANTNDCKSPHIAIDWADDCLDAFESRFPPTLIS